MNVSPNLKRYAIAAIAAVAFNGLMLLLTLTLSKHAEMTHPMMGRLVDVDDVSIHVVADLASSDKSLEFYGFDAIVLLHGSGTSLLDFSTNLLPALAEQYPVVAIDRPGHGYSERGRLVDIHNPEKQAAVVLNTLSELGVKKPVILGHSWAGSVVLASLLIRHAEVQPVAGITLSGVSHPRNYKPTWLTRLALSPTVGIVFRWLYLAPVGRFMIAPTVEDTFEPNEVPANYINNTGLVLSVRPQAFLFNEEDRAYLDKYLTGASKRYGSIVAPLLSIVASEDKQVPNEDHHNKLVQQLPQMQTYVLKDAGHMPHHTHSEQVMQQIDRFLRDLRLRQRN